MQTLTYPVESSLYERAIEQLKHLSEDRIKEAIDFMEYLRNKELREEWEATEEILADEGMMKGIMEGEAQIARGEVYDWDEVREDV
ncbi:MAG: hypothetical protein B1H02_06800 [Candidatus Latescibacteria bacterium 4484_107]|nr:MAG: hypothetical protein B1H02_06800 [Candidatus Latescibacteria bacterium 4484_107]